MLIPVFGSLLLGFCRSNICIWGHAHQLFDWNSEWRNVPNMLDGTCPPWFFFSFLKTVVKDKSKILLENCNSGLRKWGTPPLSTVQDLKLPHYQPPLPIYWFSKFIFLFVLFVFTHASYTHRHLCIYFDQYQQEQSCNFKLLYLQNQILCYAYCASHLPKCSSDALTTMAMGWCILLLVLLALHIFSGTFFHLCIT